MTHAIRIHETGGPEVLRYEESDPGTPGPGWVRVRHTAAAWDWRLLWFISFGGGDADKLEKVQY